jgi:uncharacterized protein (DUF58 family)
MTQRAAVVGGLLLVCLAGFTLTGRAIFASLSVLFAGVLAVARLWSWASLRGLHLERSSRSLTSQVGRVFEESLALSNHSLIPKLWVEVRDDSDLPGWWASARAIGLSTGGEEGDFRGHRASAVAAGLGRGQTWLWTARTICTRRGRFRLGPTTLLASDPFGLFPARRRAGEVSEIVVLPPAVPLASFPVPAGRLTGGEALRRRTYQVTPNAAGVRDYAHGDSLSRIHWKSTARRGRLISKEFELDPMSDSWVVLDGQRVMHFAEAGAEEPLGAGKAVGRQLRLPPSTEEYMIAAAASIALFLLSRNRATGLLGYGESRLVVQPERGEAQLFRILEALAGFQSDGAVDLTDVFRIEASWFPRGAAILVVTPNIRDDLVYELLELRRRGLAPVATLIEPEDFGSRRSSRGLALALAEAGIAVRVVRRGQPLEQSLGQPSGGPRRVAA